MTDVNQVRINELARELEVKAKAIIDLLPGYGVTEKKTHSSSIPADVAEKVRKNLQGAAEAEAQVEAADKADRAGSTRGRCSSATQGAGSCTRSGASSREASRTRNGCACSNSDSSVCACRRASNTCRGATRCSSAARSTDWDTAFCHASCCLCTRCRFRTCRGAGKIRRSSSAIADRKSRSTA